MASSPKRSLRKRSSQQQLTFAPLEPRQLLAADFQITEFLASNNSGILNDNFQNADWIEIYNAGNMTGNIGGYTLTDDAGDPTKYTLPSRNLGAGQYLIVFADTDPAPNTGASLYTGFKLSGGGEYVGLFDPAGNLLSEFGNNGADYPAQSQDVSYGVEFSGLNISSSNQVGFFNTPTPGSANGTLSSGAVAQVEASTPAGFYDSAFQVTLATDTAGATIRYTVDGSDPALTGGIVYNGPITVNQTTVLRAAATRTNFSVSQSETWTYLFLDDVLTQSNNGQTPANFPADWGANAVDYGIDPQVVAIEGAQAVKDALLAIPSWSITTDIDNLFDPDTGIYANPLEDGRLWEREASVELLNGDGSEGFQIDAGIRIRGGFSRQTSNAKHSFRLFFRGEYGESNLEYPVLGDSGTDVFDKIDLRTAQNYSWSKEGDSSNNFIVDEFARQNQLALGQPTTQSSWLHLYLNGQYWGLYQTQERADAAFAADYLGGEEENYDVIKPDAGIGRPYTNEATNGNITAYNDLAQLAQARAADGTTPAFVSNAAYYAAQGLNADGTPNANLDTLLDVDNLIDYIIPILHGGNFDAPISNFLGNVGINNYIAIRDRTGDEGFKFFVHDSEHSYRSLDENRNGPYNNTQFESNVSRFNPQWLHQQLMANAEYRITFADRVQEVFANDGPLSTQNLLDRWDALASQIDQAIIGESARWGDAERSSPLLRANWLNAVANVRNNILAQRNDVFLNQLENTVLELRSSPGGSYNRTVSAPLLPSIDAPAFTINGDLQNGGLVDSGDDLRFNGSGGTVYYTTDGSDPRNLGGTINSSAQVYNSSTTTSTLISQGSSWNYLANGTNQGTNWRNPNFDDSGWLSGDGELGYGDGNEATNVGFVGGTNNKNITTYFRKDFTSTGNYQSATLSLIRDDGIAVYINGVEVVRDNLAANAGFNTPASSVVADDEESTFMTFTIPASLLVAGNNTIAVEIHQFSGTSSDISFDAILQAGQQSAPAVTLNSTTPVQSRIRSANGTWSALQASVFVVADEVASASNIRISEINYNPDAGAEFIELQNINSAGGATVDLSNVSLTNGPIAPLTLAEGTTLAAGQYGLLVGNVAAFTAAYPTVNPALILGVYQGGLSNSGEGITLVAADSSVINDLDYNDTDPFPIAADGAGASLELISPASTPADQLSKYYRWQSSFVTGGTPGAAAIAAPNIVINEVFAHSDAPNSDFIELRNNGLTAVNIGGWYLSDSANALSSFQIPAGTVISAGGYVVFDESDFNTGASSFALSSNGDEVWLTSGTGNATRFVDAVSFDATFNSVSVGRGADGTGRLLQLAARTPGAVNTAAAVSPIVISEVNYHPADPSNAALAIEPGITSGELEFIEVTNTLATTVNLADYRLRGETDFDFTTQTIGGNQSVVIVSFDPSDPLNTNRAAAFRAHYGISSAVQLIGDSSGALSNSFGRVALQRADSPNADGSVPFVLVDELLYDDLAPFAAADGNGSSLNRIAANFNGTLGGSWNGAVPTPGTNTLASYSPEVLASVRDNGAIARPDLIDTISYVFDADVIVSKGSLQLFNQTLGSSVNADVASVGFTYDAATLTATWDVSALNLNESLFQAILLQSVRARGSNIILDGDGNQAAGGHHVQQIYAAIPGDANLDGDVDVNDANIFTQSNTGDAAIVFSNIGASNVGWREGDFNADGDVDVTQFNIFTGVQSGDLAILLSNVGKNVGNFQVPVTFQPVVAQPVIAQPQLVTSQPQPVTSQPVTPEPVVVQPLAVVAAVESPSFEAVTAPSVEAPAPSVALVAPSNVPVQRLSVSVAETEPSVEPTNQPLLSDAQLYVDSSEDSLRTASFVPDAYPAVSPISSALALSGSVDLLDEAFAEDFEGPDFDVSTVLDETDVEAIF